MTELLTLVPPAFVVLAAAVAIAYLPRRAAHAVGFTVSLAVGVWSLLLRSMEGALIEARFMGFDVVLLYSDEFTTFMGVLFGFFGAAGFLYAHYTDASAVQSAFALSYVGSSVGAVYSGDWLTLVVYWEIMAVTSTLLVWHYRGKAVRAAYRYALVHGLGGSLLMFAVILHYVETGFTGFGFAGGISDGLPALFAALGIGVNVGVIGLHAWIPDTYPRPHVAASVFLCAYTTKTGVYAMYRAFPEGNAAVAYMGGAMAVYGVTYALMQKDMRRLLSYHIQAQVGYMLAAIGVGGAFAAAAGFFHLFNNVLYKGLLFMTAGAIVYATHENDLSRLGGLRKQMPVTFAAFLVAALSITAVPPFNGFVSKGMVLDTVEYEFTGAATLMGYDVLWWLLSIGAVGTFMSFIKFGYYAFYHGDSEVDAAAANTGQKAVMAAVALACVAIGVFYGVFFDLLPATEQWAGDTSPYSFSHVSKAMILGAVGLIGFYATKPLLAKVHGAPDVDALYNPVFFYGGRGTAVGTMEIYRAVDDAVVAAAKEAAAFANDPGGYIEDNVPERFEDRLQRRRDSTPGDTGLRLGIGESVFVVSLSLAFALYLVL